VVVVDAANVVGSVPDGWWRDRAGAAGRLLEQVAALAGRGMDASDLDLPADTWFPEFDVVVEGAARGVDDVAGAQVVRAEGHGDDEIVAVAERAVGRGGEVTVVTSDRELAERVAVVGAQIRSVSWLRERL